MITKKIILGLFAISFLGACATPTVMLGPAYTLSSTGSAVQAGISYGSNELITMYTGKTPIENVQKMLQQKENENKIVTSAKKKIKEVGKIKYFLNQ